MRSNVLKPVHIIQILIALAIVLVSGFISITGTANAQNDDKIVITFFWGDGCPHCAAEKPFLLELTQKYPQLEVRTFEIYYNPKNIPLAEKLAKSQGFEITGVPTTFLADKHWTGFSEGIAREIEETVKTCIADGCQDATAGVFTQAEIDTAIPISSAMLDAGTSEPSSSPAEEQNVPDPGSSSGFSVPLPWLGTVDLASQSLPIATALIAFVDGFNPCSIWALTMLLALTLHTGSRKKVMIIGLVFITVTAGIYALFILGLFSVLSVLSFTGWIRAVVALVALFFALVNIKDYFWYKEGLSLTIADDKKPGLFQKMRKVMDAGDSLWGLVGATIVLSAGVSLVEFSCTAGFPVIWVNLLTSQQVTPMAFGLLLLLYMVIYQIDELAIFMTAVVTLKSNRVEEKHGRILKLAGGMLMLSLALVMLINPTVMNTLNGSLVIFGIAIAATVLILLIHRKVLPAYGIHIGSELNSRKKSRRR
jgi:thiol-disulfide isomerase/thioredoxin